MNYIFALLLFCSVSSYAQTQITNQKQMLSKEFTYPSDIQCGAEQTHLYIPQLRGKNIALVANHSSVINNIHLVDSLLSRGVQIKKVFSPEHGFRGKAAAGARISNQVDKKTGLPIISLYGAHKKPTVTDLQDIQLVIFDIQDVGLRFYTYISTLHLVMEACAENNITLLVLDRPNPHGHYIDGPVLDPSYSSFVGMDAIPIVHGLTVGEYAQMVNGEKWLKDGVQCKLEIIKVKNYTHSDLYQLPIAPSPNLPNMASVYLYPSLCLFEGTPVSIGRGTAKPFQMYGHPKLTKADTIFTPKPNSAAPRPKLNGQKCNGYSVRDFGMKIIPQHKQIYLFWLIESYNQLKSEGKFFTSFFDKLAGTDQLRISIEKRLTEEQIRESWEPELKIYKAMRKNYLLYPDYN